MRIDPDIARQLLGFLIRNDPSPANLARDRNCCSGNPVCHRIWCRAAPTSRARRPCTSTNPMRLRGHSAESAHETRRHYGPAGNLFISHDLAQLTPG